MSDRGRDAEALVRRMAVELAYANCGGEVERGSAEGEQLVRDAEAFIGRPMKHWAEVASEDGKPWEKPFVCTHEARARRLEEIVGPLARFWRMVREEVFSGISDEDAQEWAEKAGLFKLVPYDPEIHGNEVEAEPGDMIYTDTPASAAALAWEEGK